MRTRSLILLLCLLVVAGAWLLWQKTASQRTKLSTPPTVAAPSAFAPLRHDKAVQSTCAQRDEHFGRRGHQRRNCG